MNLELASTEQIIEELTKRNLTFVLAIFDNDSIISEEQDFCSACESKGPILLQKVLHEALGMFVNSQVKNMHFVEKNEDVN
ncbi:MAG: hypothetical protein DRJ03_03475 [Chloroflexi bacterium]|nr:MAG: hypothetical protein DRJ03_03475 [Chloroflexota bacterium]